MRKGMAGMAVLLLMQGGQAELVITARDYAVDSDVVLESAVREVKAIPQDTANIVGDAVAFAADETVTAVKGVQAAFNADPLDRLENKALKEIATAWDSSNDLLFRSYKVSAEVGKNLTQGADVPAGAALDAAGFFTGIEFPEGASAWYRPEFNRLFVRNTLSNVLSIEDVLAEQHSAVRDMMGKQVEIETKFIEVNQSTLNQLGFDWTFFTKGGDVPGVPAHIADNVSLPANQTLFSTVLRTASGVVGGGKLEAINAALPVADTLSIAKTAGSLRWEMTINALEQADDADVLSAPRLVTRDGNKASIAVGEERAVSEGFKVKTSESSLYIQHKLDNKLMGVRLEVTPKIRTGDLIDLKLKPQVIDLIGYETYKPTPDNAQGDKPASLTAQVPYYRLREITTEVTVADGSTVGMGGLIYDKTETFKDKVPVLGSIPMVGRLFRSEGERSVKRNLMIFVTATQVDVAGRRAADLALKK